MRHKRLPEHERAHLRIRFIVEQMIKRVLHRFFLAAVILILIDLQRESRDGLRQNTDTGIDRRHLHSRAFRYNFAGGAAAHIEGVA